MKRRKWRIHNTRVLQNDKNTMLWVTVRIPRLVLDVLDDLVRKGHYRNRSEAIREILRIATNIKAKTRTRESSPQMTVITQWMPTIFLDAIDDLVRQGIYPHKAEFIREAVRLRLRQLKAL